MNRRVLALVGSFILATSVSWVGTGGADASPSSQQPPPSSPQALPAERTFPADSGMLNVQTMFGAKGDGTTDDTAAIQAAISAVIRKQATSRIIYFPAGTYLVSSPLLWKDTTRAWNSELTFQGENQGTTSIKLTDNNPAYQDPSAPAPVIQTASFRDPATRGDDGSGNDAYDNFFFDMSIDTGQGNPGATALDFMGNNYCGLRNVTLKSSDPEHVGVVGLNMTRYATGPCMFKNVVIDGFNYGIETGQQEYSTTFDGLSLKHQHVAGIQNNDNVMSIENLTSTNTVPVIQNNSTTASLNGLVTLLGAKLTGGSPDVSAIQNRQTLYARDVVTSGYRSALEDPSGNPIGGARVSEYDSGPVTSLFGGSSSSLNLPIKETPQFEETDLSKWKSVVAEGADPAGGKDSSDAVQAAIDSGATTVYFPAGRYKISKTVTVRGNVRMIEGFDSRVVPDATASAAYTNNTFLVFKNTADVIVDHVRFGDVGKAYPDLRMVEDDSSHALTIRDTVFDGTSVTPMSYTNGPTGTGDLFLEDAVGGSYDINRPQHVYARQLNVENRSIKLLNNGATVWIFGIKTEHSSANPDEAGVIDTENSGKTELLGGLVYVVSNPVPVAEPGFIINNASASFVYAVSVHATVLNDPNTPDADFKTQIQETQKGVTKKLASAAVVTRRGQGLMMPLYVSKPAW